MKQWEAEITEQIPDQRIAWKSMDGSPNAGVITFEEVGTELTMVTAIIEYEPEGFIEKTGDALGIPSGRVERDLQRFRDYIEQRGRETGAWRGQIGEGDDSSLRSEAAEKYTDLRAEPLAGMPEEEPSVSGGRQTGDIEVPLSKEEVRIGKREVSAGDIKVRRKVETEQVSVPVELKREEAVVERVSPSETRSTGKQPFQEERIEVPLKREEPVVEKESRVTGGVRIRKTEGVEEQTVQENVRREAVDIDESGNARAAGRRPAERDPEKEE